MLNRIPYDDPAIERTPRNPPGRRKTCDCWACDKCQHREYMRQWRRLQKQKEEDREEEIRHLIALGAW